MTNLHTQTVAELHVKSLYGDGWWEREERIRLLFVCAVKSDWQAATSNAKPVNACNSFATSHLSALVLLAFVRNSNAFVYLVTNDFKWFVFASHMKSRGEVELPWNRVWFLCSKMKRMANYRVTCHIRLQEHMQDGYRAKLFASVYVSLCTTTSDFTALPSPANVVLCVEIKFQLKRCSFQM